MHYLTKQEKLCLTVFFIIAFAGLFLQISFKKYPQLKNIVNIIDDEAFYPKLDVNRAGVEELKELPGIGAFTAQTIIDYRKQKGAITSLKEIENLPGVYPKNFKRFRPYLKVSP